MDLSIIITVFNEEESVRELYDQIMDLKLTNTDITASKRANCPLFSYAKEGSTFC